MIQVKPAMQDTEALTQKGNRPKRGGKPKRQLEVRDATETTLPTTPTAQSRSLPCPAAVVPPLAMAHVSDARAGAGPGRSPCISITLLAWAACCVSSPHLPLPPGHRDLADAALRCLAANSQEYPPSQDDVGLLYGAGLRRAPSFAAASALR